MQANPFYLARMLPAGLSAIPIIATSRLLLRGLEESDALEVFHLRSNPEVMRYIPKPLNTRVEESLQMIQEFRTAAQRGDSLLWAITVKGNATVMGYIGFWRIIHAQHHAEVGYALHPNLWGQGLMTEALLATLQFGFGTMRLHSVEAQVTTENSASAHVLERAGFTLKSQPSQGQPKDTEGFVLVYECLKHGQATYP